MVKYAGFIFLIVLSSSCMAFAQVGGPEIPKGNSTMSQYCWNGTCQTPIIPNLNGSISGNDTNREMLTHYNIIMIIPSEVCTNAFKNNVKTDCPPLENLTKYDNSNQHISGYFYSPDGKHIDRTNPQVKNHWQYYGYTNHTIICVYCTGNYLTTDLYKTIILQQSDSFEYAPHNYFTSTVDIPQYNFTTGNFTHLSFQQNDVSAGLTTFFDRQVVGCNTATIAYSDQLLNDTIQYLKSNCKKTNFNQTKTYAPSNTPWDYVNPYSSLHYVKAISSMFKGWSPGSNGTIVSGIGLGECIIHHCDATTSTRKAGY